MVARNERGNTCAATAIVCSLARFSLSLCHILSLHQRLIFLARSRFSIFCLYRSAEFLRSPSCVCSSSRHCSGHAVANPGLVVFRFCSRFVRTVTVIQGIIFLRLIEITLINNRSKTMHFLSNRVIAIVCIYFIRTRIRSMSRERERENEEPRAQSRTEY